MNSQNILLLGILYWNRCLAMLLYPRQTLLCMPYCARHKTRALWGINNIECVMFRRGVAQTEVVIVYSLFNLSSFTISEANYLLTAGPSGRAV